MAPQQQMSLGGRLVDLVQGYSAQKQMEQAQQAWIGALRANPDHPERAVEVIRPQYPQIAAQIDAQLLAQKTQALDLAGKAADTEKKQHEAITPLVNGVHDDLTWQVANRAVQSRLGPDAALLIMGDKFDPNVTPADNLMTAQARREAKDRATKAAQDAVTQRYAVKKDEQAMRDADIKAAQAAFAAAHDQPSADHARTALQALGIAPEILDMFPNEYDPSFGMTPNERALLPIQKQNADSATSNAASNALNAQTSVKRETREQQQNGALFGNPAGTGDGKTGADLLSSLNPQTGATVKALSEGRMAFPTGAALRSTYWQNMLQMVAQYDPSFDAVNYNARSQTRKAFTSGKEAGQVNTLNTAIEHMAELADVADKLRNTRSRSYNSVANWLSTEFGANFATNFETVVHRVAPELVGAYRGTGGAEADIQTNMKDFRTDASPDQLHGAISETAKLLESKIAKLQEQYDAGMGTQHISVVSPKAQEVLDRLAGPAPASSTGPSTVKMRAPNGQTQDVPADQVAHFKSLGATVVP